VPTKEAHHSRCHQINMEKRRAVSRSKPPFQAGQQYCGT
jgi:hypothetical protein